LRLGLHVGFRGGSGFDNRRVENPPREGERDGPRHLLGILGHRHEDRDHPLFVDFLRLDGIDPFAGVVQWLAAQRRRFVDSSGNGAQFGFGIELGRRQVAGLGRTARAEADQFADHRQSAAQNGNRQDHLEQRQAAANSAEVPSRHDYSPFRSMMSLSVAVPVMPRRFTWMPRSFSLATTTNASDVVPSG
jgi:hypothetical protein